MTNIKPMEGTRVHYVDQSTLTNMDIASRAMHGLLASASEILSRAVHLSTERSIDPAVVAEAKAAWALANAARAMIVAIHETRGRMP